jgi:hypothetical protein
MSANQDLYIAILFCNASLTLTKVSIVLQYLRVFVGRIRYACWVALELIVLYGIATIITSIFTCTPISAFWTNNGHCINKPALWFFNTAFNI